MEGIIDQLLNLLAWFAIGIIVLYTAGIWLFYKLKRDAERRDELEAEAKRNKS